MGRTPVFGKGGGLQEIGGKECCHALIELIGRGRGREREREIDREREKERQNIEGETLGNVSHWSGRTVRPCSPPNAESETDLVTTLGDLFLTAAAGVLFYRARNL